MALPSRPNIVLLVADHWRAESAGYWGNGVVQTPCIDALVKEGAGFRKCFVQNPVSTPSRVALASGRYAHVCGHRTMHHHLRRHEANMLRTFKENGYFVWWGGKNDMIALEVVDDSCHIRVQDAMPSSIPAFRPEIQPGHRLYRSFLQGRIPEGQQIGFHFMDDASTRKACEFIRACPGGQPFFLLLTLVGPHPPFVVDEPWYSMHDRAKVPFPRRQKVPFEGKPQIMKRVSERMKLGELTEADWREIVAVFYGMVARVDHSFGQVIEALKAKGIYDNSIVIITSDHGEYCGDYLLVEKTQNTFEDVLTNVPLAIRAPGLIPLAAPSDALCQWIDILPTLHELTGVEPVEDNNGRSLAPILRGETAEIRDAVYCEGGALPSEEHTHEHDIGPDSHYWARLSVQRGEREWHGKAVMIRTRQYKYVRRLFDTDELYDMTTDPNELHNRIDDPALAQVKLDLQQRLLTWFLETGDAVPWRWNPRSWGEKHPAWSAKARNYGTL